MLTSHRQSPNQKRERREKVQQLVRERMGRGVICSRCGATYATYEEKCEADLTERCPGANAILLVQLRAEQQVGLK